MKKLIQLLLTTTLFCAMLFCLSGGGGSDALTLNVYNWGGDYIANGSEGSFDSIAGFEDWYKETYGEEVEGQLRHLHQQRRYVCQNQHRCRQLRCHRSFGLYDRAAPERRCSAAFGF